MGSDLPSLRVCCKEEADEGRVLATALECWGVEPRLLAYPALPPEDGCLWDCEEKGEAAPEGGREGPDWCRLGVLREMLMEPPSLLVDVALENCTIPTSGLYLLCWYLGGTPDASIGV